MVVDRDGPMWKAIELVVVGLIAINVALTGWSLSTIVELKTDMAATKANRFTSRDGMDLEKRLGLEISSIWKGIASVREAQALKADRSGVPPAEVMRRLSVIEQKLDILMASNGHVPGG